MINRAYTWDLRRCNSTPFAYQLRYFTDAECDRIIEAGLALPATESYLGTNGQVDNSIRKNLVAFFENTNPANHWIYEKLAAAVTAINTQFWDFDLDFIETMQFTRYDRIDDFYTNHIDTSFGKTEQRKLSISVQLSDPASYQGSNLEFMKCGDSYYDPIRERGSIMLFPSFMQHRVTPLTAGVRYSLVSWVIGPPFK